MVEYAPYQKLPKLKKRPDLRMGSIDEDPDYLQFLEKLKEQPAMLPSAEVQLDRRLAEEKEKMAAAGGVMPAIITPLIEDIRAKRAARNAPRTILQAPKRRGDRSEKKRISKEEKDKREAKASAKARDRNSRRRRERDERKKKKKDSTPKDEGDEGAGSTTTDGSQSQPAPQNQMLPQATQQGEKAKSSRTGLWMIRNHITNLEPGSITIQTRGTGGANSAKPSPQPTQSQQPQQLQQPQQSPQQPLNTQPQQQQQQQGPSQSGRRSREGTTADRDYKSRGGKRESKKIYTPKQVQQVTPQASQTQLQPAPNVQISTPTVKKGV